MRIVCPGCGATYDVPEALLGTGGRTVRCARCSSEWTASPIPSDAPPAPVPTGEMDDPFAETMRRDIDEAMADDEQPPDMTDPRVTGLRPRPIRRPSAPPALPPPESSRPVSAALAIAAWAASLLVLAAAGAAAVAWRTEVMAAWPPSERVYAAIGLR
jgi:predicted Zn finger-like uncharacterized protein